MSCQFCGEPTSYARKLCNRCLDLPADETIERMQSNRVPATPAGTKRETVKCPDCGMDFQKYISISVVRCPDCRKSKTKPDPTKPEEQVKEAKLLPMKEEPPRARCEIHGPHSGYSLPNGGYSKKCPQCAREKRLDGLKKTIYISLNSKPWLLAWLEKEAEKMGGDVDVKSVIIRKLAEQVPAEWIKGYLMENM